MPWEDFTASVTEAQKLAQPEGFGFLHRIGESYATLRRYAPEFLDVNLSAALRERSGWQKAVVALANKNARILWAAMTRGEAFDANHPSVKPVSA